MANCPHFSMYLTKPKDMTMLITRTRCKMWNCEYCAKKNKAEWRKRLLSAVNSKMEWKWYFWTLTAHEDDRTPEGSLESVSRAYGKVMPIISKWQKKAGLKTCYLRILEAHKDGALHIHVMYGVDEREYPRIRPDFIPTTKWLSKAMRSENAGWKTDARPIEAKDTAHVTNYVIKYLTKMDRPLPKYCRRVQCSQGWVKAEKADIAKGWKPEKSMNVGIVGYYWSLGYDVYDVQRKSVINSDNIREYENHETGKL